MRILGAADFHGDISIAKKLATKAHEEKVDLVVLCGDLLEEHSTENIIKPFIDVQKKVLLISGNHESLATADFLATLNNVKHLHGYSVRYDDIGFFGCGSANCGIHSLSETEIHQTLLDAHAAIAYLPKKVMVTHVHPKHSKMALMTVQNFGSSGVSQALVDLQPDILLCSHLHEAEGVEEIIGKTRVINVGTEGKIIDV